MNYICLHYVHYLLCHCINKSIIRLRRLKWIARAASLSIYHRKLSVAFEIADSQAVIIKYRDINDISVRGPSHFHYRAWVNTRACQQVCPRLLGRIQLIKAESAAGADCSCDALSRVHVITRCEIDRWDYVLVVNLPYVKRYKRREVEGEGAARFSARGLRVRTRRGRSYRYTAGHLCARWLLTACRAWKSSWLPYATT